MAAQTTSVDDLIAQLSPEEQRMVKRCGEIMDEVMPVYHEAMRLYGDSQRAYRIYWRAVERQEHEEFGCWPPQPRSFEQRYERQRRRKQRRVRCAR